MNTTENTCELLPWYINGTLLADEMERVSRHLDVCDDCVEELNQSVSFSIAYQRPTAEVQRLEQSQESALAKLRQQVENSETQASDIWSRIRGIPRQAAAVTALCLLCLTLAVPLVLNRDVQQANPDFNLLFDTTDGTGQVIQIIFHKQANEQEIRDILEFTNAEQVVGPSPAGVYEVQIAPSQNFETKLEGIKAFSQVKWAAIAEE